MARPTNKAALSKKGVEAIDKIRGKLPDIVDALLEQGFGKPETIECPKCRFKFEIEVTDAKTLQWLWERAEGKVPEQQTDTTIDKLSRLFSDMAAAGLEIKASAGSPALSAPVFDPEVDDDDSDPDEGGED